MTDIPTICPDIQEEIVNMLPDNGHTALKVMAQLCANMLLSIKDADLGLFIKDIQDNFALYRSQRE